MTDDFDFSNSKSKNFSKLEDQDNALQVLKRMASGLSDVVIWTKGREVILQTKLSGYTEDAGLVRAMVPRGMDRHEVVEVLNKIRDEEVYVCVISARGNIFFRCNYDSFNEEQMRFRKPKEIFKVQRRRHLRMKVHDNVQLQYVEPKSNETTSSKILDISAGGAAILVDYESGENFTIRCELKNLSFRIRDTTVTATGIVRYLVDMPPKSRTRGIKVGVEFSGLSEASIQAIMSYILEKEVPRSNPFS